MRGKEGFGVGRWGDREGMRRFEGTEKKREWEGEGEG